MAMHESFEDAKSWLPKGEHIDIACYVSASDYSALEAKLAIAVDSFLAIKKHTTHPEHKPSVWNDYLQDMVDEALSKIGGAE